MRLNTMVKSFTSGNTAKQFGCALVLCTGFLLANGPVFAETVFYRYVNEQGVKVINHSIPPEYAQKGYEVVNMSGQVVKVVPPALSPEEAQRQAKAKAEQKKLEEWDADLHRRYSSISDIEAAKARRLRDLETNVAILNSNISNLQAEIRDEQANAARIERQGREVPNSLLVKISNLQAELEDTRAQVKVRKKDYEAVAQSFDRDIERFKVITGKSP